MKASISLTFAISDSDTYKVDLNLPTGTPTKGEPFTFQVAQMKEGKQTDTVLNVALGDKDNIYVAVSPPKSLLQEVGVEKIVKDLDVVVKEGEYDPAAGAFK